MGGWRCYEYVFLEHGVLEVKFIFLTRQNSILAIISALNLFLSVFEVEGTAKSHVEEDWLCRERDACPWRETERDDGAYVSKGLADNWGWCGEQRRGILERVSLYSGSIYSASTFVQFPIYSLK